MAGLKVITAPAVEPVTIDDVKTQLRIDVGDPSYDDILTPLVIAARQWCEEYQDRSYITQTLELAADCWPKSRYFRLPRPKLQSVASLIYTDEDGTDATWASSNYLVDDYSYVARLVIKDDVDLPTVTLASSNAIKIRYVAGYGDEATDVPQLIKIAITMLAAHWFDNGYCDPPPGVLALLNMDRVVSV